ncbi:YadA-like family protein [Trinickia sp. YCB016]
MNRVYRVVWNVATASWSAVAETAKGRTKGTRRVATVSAVAAAVLAVSMGTAFAADACKTSDGRNGTLDEQGICQVAQQQPKIGASPSVSATLDDTYFKVNSTGAAASATGSNAVAIGPGAAASNDNAIAIGNGAIASGSTSSVAIGLNAQATTFHTVAIGENAKANGQQSIAIGNGAAVSAPLYGVAIGTGASTTTNFSTALGSRALATGQFSTAVGGDAAAAGSNSSAFGADSKVTSDASLAAAIGNKSVADRSNTISVGSSSLKRQIVNVGAGTQANDAVNVSQLSPVVSALGGGASIDAATGAVTGPTYNLTNGGTQTTVGGALTGLDNAITQISNGSIGLVKQDATTGNITVAMGLAGSLVDFTGSAGPRVLKGVANGVDDSDAVTLAQLKSATAGMTENALVYDDATLASATLGGSNGTVLKNVAAGLVAAGSMEAVNGGQLYAMQQDFANRFDKMQGQIDSIVDGGGGSGGGGDDGSHWGTVTGNNGTAIGQGSTVSGDNSVAIGQGATATGNNSVAIGNGSVADRDNTVSVGAPGQERQITNVAAGTAPTDAVNVQQMRDTVRSARQDAMGGVAAAMAVAGLPQSTLPGRTFVAVAGSTYGGEEGTAVGVSYMTRDGKWTFKASANTSTRGEVGVVVGGGVYW